MVATRPRYSEEELARRGDAIGERDLAPALEADKEGQVVAIDIQTGT